MVWSPGAERTRVLVTRGQEILLKARLSPGPAHPRAAQWLMEAIALWEGTPVRAVISADARADGYGSRFWDAVGMDFGGALYSLELGGPERAGRRQLSFFEDSVPELDGFSDLEAVAVSGALGGER
jgi:hypothetical protein